jgi:hypothetical protein
LKRNPFPAQPGLKKENRELPRNHIDQRNQQEKPSKKNNKQKREYHVPYWFDEV